MPLDQRHYCFNLYAAVADEEFRPTEETVKRTLPTEEIGFSSYTQGCVLTIVGEQKEFEKAFRVRLTTKKATVGVEVHTENEASIPSSNKYRGKGCVCTTTLLLMLSEDRCSKCVHAD